MSSHEFAYQHDANDFEDPLALVETAGDTDGQSEVQDDFHDWDPKANMTIFLAQTEQYPLLTAAEEVELANLMSTGLQAKSRLGNSQARFKDETRLRLEQEAQAGREAKERFINSNLRLVVSIAKHKEYLRPGISLSDTVQEGMFGLIRAVEKFDPEKGYKFSTYATYWIKQACKRGVELRSRIIYQPLNITENIRAIYQVERHFRQMEGRNPTDADYCDYLDINAKQLEDLRSAQNQRIFSLNKPIGEFGESELGDLFEDENAEDSAEIVHGVHMKEMLDQSLERLEEEERTVISHLFGVDGAELLTSKQVTEIHGIPSARVRSLGRSAMEKLANTEELQAFAPEGSNGHQSLAEKIIDSSPYQPVNPNGEITEAVLHMLACGDTNVPTIVNKLAISPSTARDHITLARSWVNLPGAPLDILGDAVRAKMTLK